MHKALTISIFLLLFSTITLKANDSIMISNLENKIEMLEYKVDTLENSTDRLLNGLYVTISLILASVMGLNIWNWIVQSKKNSQKIDKKL